MKQESKHLAEIIEDHNRACNLQVVFFDIENYSKRRTLNQISVIDSLTECARLALSEIAKEFVDYTQRNNLNFKTDVITIPTGDGSAVVFSFDGLADVHLKFARVLLKIAHGKKLESHCPHFEEHGWCNCHDHFNLRIGISEDRGIVYNDINGNYNVAGSVINLCSRVMALADRNQIMFTESAYKRIIDMATDPTFLQRFVEFREVPIKHNERINVYQYVAPEDEFINSQPPAKLFVKERFEGMLKKLAPGFQIPSSFIGTDKLKPSDVANALEHMGVLFDILSGASPTSSIEVPTNTLTSEKRQI